MAINILGVPLRYNHHTAATKNDYHLGSPKFCTLGPEIVYVCSSSSSSSAQMNTKVAEAK